MHRSRLGLLALLAAFVPAAPAEAQPAASAPAASAPADAAPALRPPVHVRAVSVRPGDPTYPVEWAARGVQGTAEVLVVIGDGGAPKSMAVTVSSRSGELDAAAIKVVSELRFELAQGNGGPVPNIVVPVSFVRDAVATIGKKTCAEFNTDVDYFRKTFPETDPSRMRVIDMAVGVLVLTASQQGLGDVATAAKAANAARQQIVPACAGAPGAMYLQVFRDLSRKSRT